jgi:2-dehydropantoate 2-reductase
MGSRDLSILVVGAGAIGGITAVLLKKDGYNVEIVCKYDDYATLISSEGLEVRGVCGYEKMKMKAYSLISEVKEKKDLILHATKATDMIEAAKSIKTVLKENGHVISMQNGICEDDLAEVLGREKVIGCVTGWGGTMISRGNLEMTSTGDFILGYTDRPADEFLSDVAIIMSSVVPAKVSDNIMGHLFSKLIINACISSLGAICGLYLGKMLSIKKVRNIFIEIIRESVAVAGRMQINIEVFGGRLDFNRFVVGDRLFDNLRRHMMIRIIGFKYRKLKSSSLQSLERGKPTEADYFNGYIARNGERLNVPVPVNRAIVDMIHEIERGTRKISFSNFNEPVFDKYNN